MSWDDQGAARAGDDELRALIPAHALGATDSADAAAIEELVKRDPAAAAELAHYRTLRQALLFGARPVAPPPALGERLRAATQPVPRQSQQPTSMPAPERGWRRWFAPVTRPAWTFAGVALALLIISSLWWGAQAGQLRTAQSEAQVAQAEAASAQATAEATITEYNHLLGALATGQAETAMLPATDPAATDDTHAMVIWMPGATSGMVMAEKLPPLTPGNVYQVWLVHGEDRMSGGMFQVDETGSAMLMVESPMPLDSLDGVGITQEPSGGSASPTGVPVVRGTI